MCWKLYDTLIILNLIDTYKLFRLSTHNQTNMYAAMRHVFYHPIYGTVPRANNRTFMCFFRIS